MTSSHREPLTDALALGAVKRWRKRWVRSFGRGTAGWLGRAALSLLARTWRVEFLGQENLDGPAKAGPGCFLSMWHGRMILALPIHAHRGWHVLVSPSGDGDVSEKLLEANGYHVIRGSSSRGGARALRKMLKVLDEGAVLFITPDGPRGPRHTMNPGLAFMARATGREIVPLGFACDRAWHADSWDHFTIPKPFARVCVVYGEPVPVSRKADDAEQGDATKLVRERTMDAERAGFSHLGCEVDWPWASTSSSADPSWAAEPEEEEPKQQDSSPGRRLLKSAAFLLSGVAMLVWAVSLHQRGGLNSITRKVIGLVAFWMIFKGLPRAAEIGWSLLGLTVAGTFFVLAPWGLFGDEQRASPPLVWSSLGALMLLFVGWRLWEIFTQRSKDGA